MQKEVVLHISPVDAPQEAYSQPVSYEDWGMFAPEYYLADAVYSIGVHAGHMIRGSAYYYEADGISCDERFGEPGVFEVWDGSDLLAVITVE